MRGYFFHGIFLNTDAAEVDGGAAGGGVGAAGLGDSAGAAAAGAAGATEGTEVAADEATVLATRRMNSAARA
jgi:hypothetical protein